MYIKSIVDKTKAKLVLYFHNDPLTMNGSKSINRAFLINKVKKLYLIVSGLKDLLIN